MSYEGDHWNICQLSVEIKKALYRKGKSLNYFIYVDIYSVRLMLPKLWPIALPSESPTTIEGA